jgi:hypothetical protein
MVSLLRRVKTESPAVFPETQAFRSAKMVVVIKTSRPSPILGRAGFQPDHLLSNVNLVDLYVQQFRYSPVVSPAALDNGSEPKLGAVRHDLAILALFEVPSRCLFS